MVTACLATRGMIHEAPTATVWFWRSVRKNSRIVIDDLLDAPIRALPECKAAR